MKSWVVAAMLSVSVTPLLAQDGGQIDRMVATKHAVFDEAKIAWQDEPLLPKGAKSALVIGDPAKAGVFIAYLKFPRNYAIPAHTHPFTEVVTVLKGKVGSGFGNRLDRAKGDLLAAGSSFSLPADEPHYLWNDEEAVVLLVATGPWGITYVNPKDDPRTASR
jgi:quercetin dioxygenase-like cupin family protein